MEKDIRYAWKTAKKAATPERAEELFKKELDKKNITYTLNKHLCTDGAFYIATVRGTRYLLVFDVKLITPARLTVMQEKKLNYHCCPVPHFISQGPLLECLYQPKTADPTKEFNEFLMQAITPHMIATVVNQIFSNSSHVKDKSPQIDEAIKAYYIGAPTAAATLLLVVFESVLRDLGNSITNSADNTFQTRAFIDRLKTLFDEYAKKFGFPEHDIFFHTPIELMNLKCRLHPAVDSLNAFRIFFEKVLYKSTVNTRYVPTLNRHNYLHLLDKNAQSKTAFHRLILILIYLTNIEAVVEKNSKIPIGLFPSETKADQDLATKYIRFSIAEAYIDSIPSTQKSPA